jgi:type I restriction enzyme M protein
LFPENHRFQVPADAHWREIRKVSRDVGWGLQQAMRAIETANPQKLFGIFGDSQWTNKDRLSDAMLRDLIEHFSTLELTVANLPEDELGQGYEPSGARSTAAGCPKGERGGAHQYLIKKFADDSGHTAAEPERSGGSQPQAARRANEVRQFYTNRTVVHLMTEMLDVQPGESVYDPTCGSGGMLLSCIAHLRNQKKEWRNVKLYDQERNLMTSSTARMNCFLHGIEDFRIERGDTLAEPKLVEGDSLMRFDVVLATARRDSASAHAKPDRRACHRQDNPPYSIKQWDRDAFASDPWGRNLYGTPPQGRADYAFQQHILASLKGISAARTLTPGPSPSGRGVVEQPTGRCAVLWPHGVLFRQEEADMRRKLIEADLIECVLGLGPNLFYNSPMEACVVVCRTQKPKVRRGKILFINAVNEVTRERAQSFLTDDHLQRIVRAHQDFRDEPGFTSVVPIEEIRANEGNLSIPLYVGGETQAQADVAAESATTALPDALQAWLESSAGIRQSLTPLLSAK